MWKLRFLIFPEKMRNYVLNIPQIIRFCRGRALSLPFLGQTRGSAPTLNEIHHEIRWHCHDNPGGCLAERLFQA